MKRITTLLMMTALAGTLWAVENPNLRSPVGSPTAVPSATRRGLIPSQPYDSMGRDSIVSGNVGGLAGFRGPVPYSSGYYSGSSARSPVDNFLRRSYDPIASDRSPGQYRAYYDPRRTVASSVRPDGSGLFSPVMTTHGQADPYTPPMLAQTVGTQYRPRPLSLSGAELERVLDRQMRVGEEFDRPRPTEGVQDSTPQQQDRTESVFFRDYLLPQELEDSQEPSEQEATVVDPKPEQVIRDEFLEELQEQLRQQEAERINELLRSRSDQDEHQAGTEPPLPDRRPAADAPDDSQDPALTEKDRAQAAALLDQYETFEQLAAARLAQYMTAGEGFLREGRFYQAADAFALATVWAPNDARPYAGQAFALFAAGEYMSSAFNLTRAIVRNEKVASEPVNLAELIGDRDVFESRLLEMTTWQQRSASGRLAFLMAFVLHHDGKPDRAAAAIQIAADQLPDDPAVQILSRVIAPDQNTQP